MTESSWSRREMFALLAAATTVPASAASAARVGPAGAGPVRFADPQRELEAVIRVLGDLTGREAPWWYTGVVLGVRPGEEPRPLVRFEGSEINRFTPQADGSFVLTASTVSFFQDLETGEVLDTWHNPFTGRTVPVQANVLSGRGHVVWSRAGVQPVFPNMPAPVSPLHVHWVSHGPWVWMRHDRVYPPGMPQPRAEASSMLVERRALEDDSLAAVPTHFSASYVVRYSSWMQMPDDAGHAVWHASGLKLESVEQYPQPFLERMRRLHPDRLSAPRFVAG
jgi:hypothetical protein